MPHSIVVALLVMGGLFACAWLGSGLRRRLPAHHLSDETRTAAMIGIGLLVSMASLALGVLLGEAKTRFDNVTGLVREVAVKVDMLEDDLRMLGDAGAPLRAQLRSLLAQRIDTIWHGRTGIDGPDGVATGGEVGDLRTGLLAVTVTDDGQRRAQAHALTIVDELRRLRFLSRADHSSEIVGPLLALIVFWLALITTAVNIYSPHNGTVTTLNMLGAFSVAGAIFLILEMNDPFHGWIGVSDAPLRGTLARLGT